MVVDGSEQCLVPSCKTVFSWVNVGLWWLMAVNSAWFHLVRLASHQWTPFYHPDCCVGMVERILPLTVMEKSGFCVAECLCTPAPYCG